MHNKPRNLFKSAAAAILAAMGGNMPVGVAARNPGVRRTDKWKRHVPYSRDFVSTVSAEHHGKGNSHRSNRKKLGISARQQRRFRKLMSGLPRHDDVAPLAAKQRFGLSSSVVMRKGGAR